jgi:hypothetical protein
MERNPMKKILMSSALAAVLFMSSFTSSVIAADRPYTEGPVAVVSSIRTEPGMFDEYLKWLDGPWKQAMDAQKAAGIIVDYAVYSATPRNPSEPDLYLVTTFKNMGGARRVLTKRPTRSTEKVWAHGPAERCMPLR